MKAINKLSDIIFNIEKVLAIILATVLLVSLAGGVLFRYFLKSPLIWSDELAIFCLIWMTFVGGSMSLKLKETPTITILVDSVSLKMKKVLNIISTILLLIFAGYVLYLSLQWISSPNILIQTAPSLDIKKIYFYLSIPVSFVCTVIHLINSLLISITETEKEAVKP